MPFMNYTQLRFYNMKYIVLCAGESGKKNL
jgi:hypothetical protein